MTSAAIAYAGRTASQVSKMNVSPAFQPVKLAPIRMFSAANWHASGAASSDSEELEGKNVIDAESTDVSKERPTGEAHKYEFQAETRKLLDIVAKSLYSEKEVFIREIVSNASDALEKLRHLRLSGEAVEAEGEELAIHIDVSNGKFSIRDSGIGMSEEELRENLGTIARSGTQSFTKEITENGKGGESMIGQFGVGFYSTFMVGNRVRVFTKSARDGSAGKMWESEGLGSFDISDADGVARGTRIELDLRDDCSEFGEQAKVEDIVKKYSNFVGFPIYLNGVRVNTIAPLWTKSAGQITEDQHTEFYKFISNSWEGPKFSMMFKTDSPLQISALLYMPKTHMEMFGMEQLTPGVNLYSRKVLILNNAPGLLPNWLRFIKGVVDSEDIPLNLSRELLQDSALIKRLNGILTAKVIRFLKDKANKDPEDWNKWQNTFSKFLKEGAATDRENKDEILGLLRFESSAMADKGGLTSLDDYIDRNPDEKKIFFLRAPNRNAAVHSPYFEEFAESKKEVVFVYEAIDEVLFTQSHKFKDREIVSVETSAGFESAGQEGHEGLVTYLVDTLGKDKVSEVKISTRLRKTPALVVDHETRTQREMMKMMMGGTEMDQARPHVLEINPSHPLFTELKEARESKPELAKAVAEQVYDNALVAAGLVENPEGMISRINELMVSALRGDGKKEE